MQVRSCYLLVRTAAATATATATTTTTTTAACCCCCRCCVYFSSCCTCHRGSALPLLHFFAILVLAKVVQRLFSYSQHPIHGLAAGTVRKTSTWPEGLRARHAAQDSWSWGLGFPCLPSLHGQAVFEKYKPTHVIHLAARVGGLFHNMAKKVERLGIARGVVGSRLQLSTSVLGPSHNVGA